MKFSVVIPAYNRAPIIAEAIESVLSQSHESLELIVVDDGSTDRTQEAVEGYRKDPRFRYLRQENAGAGAARNAGLRAATGEIVSFLDSDDLWKPGKLAREARFFQEHPDVGAVFSDCERWLGKEYSPSLVDECPVFHRYVNEERHGESLILPQRRIRLLLLEELPFRTSALSVQREAFEVVGDFDTTIVSGQDWDLFVRLSKHFSFGYIERTAATIRISEDSLHVLGGETRLRTMWSILSRESAESSDDGELRQAVRRGIAILAVQLGWRLSGRGRRLEAATCLFRGFRQSREPRLLLRAAVCLLPDDLTRRTRSLFSAAGTAGMGSRTSRR